MRRSLVVVVLCTMLIPAAAAAGAQSWPRGEVFIPTSLFSSKDKLDKVVLESNPRLILNKDFDPRSDHIMVVGMDGWGGRSENFAGTLYYGLKGGDLSKRLIVACIQDTRTRGPKFQGQGDKEHANVWRLDREGFQAMLHFVDRLAAEFGHLRVYFMGYSSGSVAAPIVAAYVAEAGGPNNKRYTVEGAISLGVAVKISAERLKKNNLRVLTLVVPKQGKHEYKTYGRQDNDQYKYDMAIKYTEELTSAGATAYVRFIDSARRHFHWHWGLMSQCRYFKRNRYDDGRGYWPNYWMPNPDSYGLMAIFIQGKVPPEKLNNPPQKCPHPPNVNNPDDPDAKVMDPSRQVKWPPGTTPSSKGEP